MTVLIVLGNDTAALPPILRHSNWDVQTAADVEEAIERVRSSPPCVVIVPDKASGKLRWPDLLAVIEAFKIASKVIVTDRSTDTALWAEALHLGAYDVLPQPFEAVEVFRSIRAAWDASRAQSNP